MNGKNDATILLQPKEPPYEPQVADDLAALMPAGQRPLSLFRVLAHNSRLLARFRAGRLLDEGELSER